MPAEEKTLASNELLIEQYKLYVEMADRVSTRRAETNRFYTTLLAGLLAVLSIIIEKSDFTGIINIALTGIGFLGIALCIVWYTNISSYRQLNSGKFKVINEMEKQLPFCCYSTEWQILTGGEGKPKYLRLTQVEKYVPMLLTIPYILLLGYGIRNLVCP